MPNSVLEPEYASTANIFVPMTTGIIETRVGLGQEVQSESQITFIDTVQLFSGMTQAPSTISDVIVSRLQEIFQVKVVLMGRSGDVYHVWSMIDDWTSSCRKVVYAAQRELLVKLKGFDLDFYVVALDEGVKPEDVVSDIPVVFQRAA